MIEAFQMTRERRVSNVDWPAWLHRAWNMKPGDIGSIYPESHGTDRLVTMTLEGQHLVSWGDWIIQGSKGGLYPCKPDIFEAMYDRVDDE